MSQIVIYQPSDVTTALAAQKTAKNARIANTSGQVSFGIFPLNSHGYQSAPIILKLGFIGYASQRTGAYGLRHIWEKHGQEIGISNPSDVPSFIESILIPGAEVIIDSTKSAKPLIIESKTGLITVGFSTPPNEAPHYHIITAYTRKNHPGTVIATL
ncbi:hypothetical protein [Shewanella khirikhana]|nr:hypothetical protein [Shewanella khirikhana]